MQSRQPSRVPNNNRCSEIAIQQGFLRFLGQDIRFDESQRCNDYQINLEPVLKSVYAQDDKICESDDYGAKNIVALQRVLDSLDQAKTYILRTGQINSAGHYRVVYYDRSRQQWMLDNGSGDVGPVIDRQSSILLVEHGRWGHGAGDYALHFYEINLERLYAASNYIATFRSIVKQDEKAAEDENQTKYHEQRYQQEYFYTSPRSSKSFWQNTILDIPPKSRVNYRTILAYQAGVLGDEHVIDTILPTLQLPDAEKYQFIQQVGQRALYNNNYGVLLQTTLLGYSLTSKDVFEYIQAMKRKNESKNDISNTFDLVIQMIDGSDKIALERLFERYDHENINDRTILREGVANSVKTGAGIGSTQKSPTNPSTTPATQHLLSQKETKIINEWKEWYKETTDYCATWINSYRQHSEQVSPGQQSVTMPLNRGAAKFELELQVNKINQRKGMIIDQCSVTHSPLFIAKCNLLQAQYDALLQQIQNTLHPLKKESTRSTEAEISTPKTFAAPESKKEHQSRPVHPLLDQFQAAPDDYLKQFGFQRQVTNPSPTSVATPSMSIRSTYSSPSVLRDFQACSYVSDNGNTRIVQEKPEEVQLFLDTDDMEEKSNALRLTALLFLEHYQPGEPIYIQSHEKNEEEMYEIYFVLITLKSELDGRVFINGSIPKGKLGDPKLKENNIVRMREELDNFSPPGHGSLRHK